MSSTSAPRLKPLSAIRETLCLVPTVLAGCWGAILLSVVASLAAIWLGGGFAVALALIYLVPVGAILRVSVAGDVAAGRALGLGPVGLQVGWPELRLLGSTMLCLVFLAIVVSLLSLTALALAGGAELDVAAIQARDWAAAGPAWRVALVAAVVALAILIPLLLTARLALAGPATVAQQRMVSLNAMAASRGNAGKLLLGLILAGLPGSLVTALGLGIGGMAGHALASVGASVLLVPLVLTYSAVAYRRLDDRQWMNTP